MSRLAGLGLLALVPAALNAPAFAAQSITVAVCSGDGLAYAMALPIPLRRVPGSDEQGCCQKGCHGGQRKKTQARQIDTRQ